VIILSYSVSAGVIANPGMTGFWIGLIAWVVAIVLVVRSAKKLQRERLLGVSSEA